MRVLSPGGRGFECDDESDEVKPSSDVLMT